MRTAIFLNRWNDLFHLMLMKVEGERSRRLDSRFCRSLDLARKMVGYWRAEYEVAADDVHDNCDVVLNDVFAWMEADLAMGGKDEVRQPCPPTKEGLVRWLMRKIKGQSLPPGDEG